MRHILLLFCILFAQSGVAEEIGWLDRYGNTLTNTEAKKWIGGFGGWLIITSDENWREKWNNPGNDTPVFTEAKEVQLGGKLTILTLFKNPQVNTRNSIDITCDIRMIFPDGTVSFAEKGVECAREELVGERQNVRLSPAIIEYVGELDDPYGVWQVEVILKDNIAGVSIPLRNWFEFINTTRFAQIGDEMGYIALFP